MITMTIIIILNKMYLYLFYILFIFLAIILLLFYNFSFSKDVDKYRIKTILADDLQTGDIFLTDYQNVNNFIITSLFKENFMHPSIVLKEGNEIYVLDYIANKGIIKKPLNSWHKSNSLELNVHLLIESGVIAKNRSIESYLPRDFENMKGFTTLPGFKFKEFNLINTIIF